MASIADMIAASGLQSSQSAPDLTGSVARGAELGMKMEEMKNQRQALEAKKTEVKNTKIQEMTDDLQKAKNLSGTALKGYKQFLNNKALTYQIDDLFNPETIELITAAPENLERFTVIRDDVLNGRRTLEEGIATLKDPSKFYDVTPNMLGDLYDASKTRVQANESMNRAKTMAQSSMDKQVQAQRAAPSVTEATEKAKGRVKYLSEEKAAGESAIESLEDVASKLKNPGSSKVKTGSILQAIPGIRSDAVQSVFSPETVAAKTQAQSALNAILRQTLGAQFTQQEGERVLNQIWDDKQPNTENARRILLKVKQLKGEMKAKGETLGASGGGPSEGDTKTWQGQTYKVTNGNWVKQ